MTGPKKNSEFCFPETLPVSRGEAEENISTKKKLETKFVYTQEKKMIPMTKRESRTAVDINYSAFSFFLE